MVITREPRLRQWEDTTSAAFTSGIREARVRRFAPSNPGSSAKVGAPWEMNRDGAAFTHLTILIALRVINTANVDE